MSKDIFKNKILNEDTQSYNYHYDGQESLLDKYIDENSCLYEDISQGS